jgi:hypothetical protein
MTDLLLLKIQRRLLRGALRRTFRPVAALAAAEAEADEDFGPLFELAGGAP